AWLLLVWVAQARGSLMTNQRDVLFVVFTGFFILIGLVSISVLLGFPKTADRKLREWAVRGFVVGVTTAIFGLFRLFFGPPTVPIVVTLPLPKDAMAVNLKSCRFEYDDDSGGKVVTRGGDVSPAFTQGGTWEVRLPLEVSGKPTRLRLRGDQGGA